MKNKQIYLYVDGYNIINAWPNLYKLSNDVDLDSAREELIDIILKVASSQANESDLYQWIEKHQV